MDSLTPSNYARNGKVMLASALLLFLLLLFIIFFHTHRYMCFFRRRDSRRRRLFRTSSAQGLDPSVLKFLPTFTYSSDTHRPLQDCAVCLSEFEDEDEGRLLPSCNHAFHTHCVDTWFRSHSICPLCRGPVLQPDFLARPCKPWLSSTETSSVSERDEVGMGCSSLPARRKALEERLRGWEGMGSAAPADRGFQTSDHRILSLRKTLSV